MLKISKQLLNSLNNSAVRYLHFKGNNHFLDGFNGSGDIDLLVHEADKETLYSIFKSLDFINPETQKYSHRPFIEDWIGFDSETGTLIHVHLHFSVVFGNGLLNEYTFNFTDLCFENCIERENCKIQNPSLELLILMCRVYTGALNKKEKIKKNLDYLMSVFDKADFINICRQCGVDSEEAGILTGSVKSDGFDFTKAGSVIEKLYSLNIKNAPLVLFKRKVQYKLYKKFKKKALARFTKKALKNGGIKIAFLGQDGAGKTTVTNDIVEWLRFKLEARNSYLGSGDNYTSIQKKILKAMPKKKNPALKVIAAVLVVSDLKRNARYTLKTIKKAEKYSQNGGIAVFDRYPQLSFMGINDGPKIRENYIKKADNALVKKLMLPFAKKEEKYLKKAVELCPDTVIKLMLSPEESIRRKPQENYEMVKRKHEIIKALEFPKSSVYTVDVTQKYDAEIIEIKNIIWQNLVKTAM
ncbi:MAG: hypothetical protein MJ120_06435 [Clostridia bacterium]|nr:hypothetical protein [Clostridia bacterium]